MKQRHVMLWALMLLLLVGFSSGCDDATDALGDLTKSEITGKVINNRGEPVEGATIKLFDVLKNTDFVVGADFDSGEGLIDPEKVANSDNTITTATTDAEGKISLSGVTASAFLATASKENCSLDFAGFNSETGVLNQETLLKPSVGSGGLSFDLGTFTITCAEPPENVNEDGSAEGTEEPEPQPEPSCDDTECAAEGGFCVGAVCTMPICSDTIPCDGEGICVDGGTADATCFIPACSETTPCDGEALCVEGGTFSARCVMPVCSDTIACEDGLLCMDGGTLDAQCVKPVCAIDDDCAAGDLCVEGGTLDAKCVTPVCAADADCNGDLCLNPGTLEALCIPPVCSDTIACADGLLCHNGGTLEAVCLPPVCTVDADCGDGNVCTDGGTLDAACSAPVCGASIACPDGKLCENPDTTSAVCVDPVCTLDSDCADGTLCDQGGTLLAACLPPACSVDADCADGQFCTNGGTLQSACMTPACTTEEQCADGEVCANGGTLEAACVLPMCSANEDCAEGQFCVDANTAAAVCVDPVCTATVDCPEGLICTNAGTFEAACVAPACVTDEDCLEGTCGVNETTGLAECQAADPNEIIPPAEPDAAWTVFKVQDSSGTDIVDASTENQVLGAQVVQDNTLVRVYGEYSGAETTAYVMVQTGSMACDGMEPKIDYVEVPIVDGKLNGGKGDYFEVYLYGGYMKVQLSTSNINGEGERSTVVEFGDNCMAPENPLTVILSWTIPEDDPTARADIDLHAWNADGEQCYYGRKIQSWGQLDVDDRRGPGPEVFTVTPDGQGNGPITIKVRYFSGRIQPVPCKVRVIHWDGTTLNDNSYEFELSEPREIFEVGVFELAE